MVDATGERGLSPLQAFEAVMGFARQRGEAALGLALHASVPQVVHIDLLHLLRLNFVADTLRPGVAEADVLFSPFSRDMGNGYFRFDANARLQLLQHLDPGDVGPGRPRSLQVADFLLAFFDRELAGERSDTDPLYRSWIEIERWNALAFSDPEATAEQLAAAVAQACEPGRTSARLRVGTLAASLATPLVRHHRLLRYAAGVEALQAQSAEAATLLRTLGDAPLQVGSVSLPGATGLLQRSGVTLQAEAAEATQTVEQAVKPPPAAATPPPSGTTAAHRSAVPLADCEFTAYISYAHADDEAWFSWITQFRNELERGLSAMLRGLKLPRMHMAGESGPVAGRLDEAFGQRLAVSFALIICVHDNYAQSEWCLRELERYKSLFGEEALRQRLYVVAMSEAAMLSVTRSAAWRQLLPHDDQLWMPFFDPADTSRPLDIYLGPGLVAPAFRAPFERLRSDLARKLRAAATVAPPPPTAAPVSDAVVVLGIVPPSLAEAAARAGERLREAGRQVVALTTDAVFGEFREFAAASLLVLPFDNSSLMLAALGAGGHLELQASAWLGQGKSADRIVWLDLRGPDDGPPPPGSAAAYVLTRGVASVGPDALLTPAPAKRAALAVRIYIESNRHERNLWEPLGESLRRRWDALLARHRPEQVPPTQLRCRGLPVDQIDSLPSLDDADGIVLLWGRKTSEALVAQINKVERKLSGRNAPPGIVAYLTPPQPPAAEPVPAWGWQVLRFDASDEDGIDVVDDESGELDRFLKKVLDRWLRNEAGSAS